MDPEFCLFSLDLLSRAPEFKVDLNLGCPRTYLQLSEHELGPWNGHGEEVADRSSVDSWLMDEYENRVWPILPRERQDSREISKDLTEAVWSRMRPVGAGLDPARFRLSDYGEVLDKQAQQDSPLFPHLDHIFPLVRGGLTCERNLRYISWMTNQKKGRKLECFMTRSELICGVRRSAFLFALESVNINFRDKFCGLCFQQGKLDDAVVRYEGRKACERSKASSARPYNHFSTKEVLDLVRGHLKQQQEGGRISWRRIQGEYPSLGGRTNVDLKDKVINLCKKRDREIPQFDRIKEALSSHSCEECLLEYVGAITGAKQSQQSCPARQIAPWDPLQPCFHGSHKTPNADAAGANEGSCFSDGEDDDDLRVIFVTAAPSGGTPATPRGRGLAPSAAAAAAAAGPHFSDKCASQDSPLSVQRVRKASAAQASNETWVGLAGGTLPFHERPVNIHFQSRPSPARQPAPIKNCKGRAREWKEYRAEVNKSMQPTRKQVE